MVIWSWARHDQPSRHRKQGLELRWRPPLADTRNNIALQRARPGFVAALERLARDDTGVSRMTGLGTKRDSDLLVPGIAAIGGRRQRRVTSAK